jgi:hypothetical protein
MEEWYVQQEFFDELQMEKIQSWMTQEIIDIFQYTSSDLYPGFAV